MKKTMITGVRPTGRLTLANYIGGMRKFVEQQNDYNSFIFIADIHGVTTYIEPQELQNNILDITALFLSCGINPNDTSLFIQSDILEHCNLSFLLSFHCGVGELSRMTQYKAKKANLSKNEKDMGLFIYPTLMAADILLYDASIVPVGADQRQHIEITRDLGERFNKVYGNTFTLPEYQIPRIGAKIMNLQNPTEKMNKSAPKDDKGTIFILDDLELTRKKIMSACTDSENKVSFDEDNKKGISNLISIVAAIQNRKIDEIVKEYQNYSYKDFKYAVSDIVVEFIEKVQTKFYKIRNDEEYLKEVLLNGSNIARKRASIKLSEVRKKIGLKI